MWSVWAADEPGVLTLPGGRRVRGRSLRRAPTAGAAPDWGLYLLGSRPPVTPWPQRWVRWRDFATPADSQDAVDALAEARDRSATERVEVACAGGVGRTGTALAALLVLEGMTVPEAVRTVRAAYHPRAVETPWQRRWLARVASSGSPRPG